MTGASFFYLYFINDPLSQHSFILSPPPPGRASRWRWSGRPSSRSSRRSRRWTASGPATASSTGCSSSTLTVGPHFYPVLFFLINLIKTNKQQHNKFVLNFLCLISPRQMLPFLFDDHVAPLYQVGSIAQLGHIKHIILGHYRGTLYTLYTRKDYYGSIPKWYSSFGVI